MKKFTENDIFKNIIKAHPRVRLFTYNGKIYVDESGNEELKLKDFLDKEHIEEP